MGCAGNFEAGMTAGKGSAQALHSKPLAPRTSECRALWQNSIIMMYLFPYSSRYNSIIYNTYIQYNSTIFPV